MRLMRGQSRLEELNALQDLPRLGEDINRITV